MAATRRLSPVRVGIAVVLTAALAAAGYVGFDRWQSAQAAETQKSWFAAYTDVTATPTFAFEDVKSAKGRDVMLSFVVADHDDACTPTWGSAYSMQGASDALDLDRRIARLQQQKGEVGVSFGGLANDELATTCTNGSDLVSAYESVVKRYDVSTVDYDVEGADSGDLVMIPRDQGEPVPASVSGWAVDSVCIDPEWIANVDAACASESRATALMAGA